MLAMTPDKGEDDPVAADPRKAEQYFKDVTEAFHRASARSGEVQRYFTLGEQVLCLRFAGNALEKALTDALLHNECKPVENPDLTVLCWDSTSTGVALPAQPWAAGDIHAKGYINGYNTPAHRANFEPTIDILTLYSIPQQSGIYWVGDVRIIPYWERSFPMRGMIHWWSRDRAYQLVHAGAVGMASGGVLLTGKSGSGKSTTSVACLNSPLLFAGDDYVLLSTDGKPRAYGVYNTAKLEAQSLARVPHAEAMVTNKDKLAQEKALLNIHAHYPQKMARGFPIKAIFLPNITNQTATRLREASGAEAITALAPTTLSHLRAHYRLAFDKMQRFVRDRPRYWLELGTDTAQIPKVIAEFLER